MKRNLKIAIPNPERKRALFVVDVQAGFLNKRNDWIIQNIFMRKFWSKKNDSGEEDIVEVLKRGGVAIIPTDTTYGIVGLALNEQAVHEIYRLRKRDLDKPFIILIADKKDLKKFGVKVTPAQEKILDRVWPACRPPAVARAGDVRGAGRPGAVSVILPCVDDKFAYLHRGKNTLAFRLPEKESVRRLIREVGPLVAPSANPQGHPVARTISEAKAYFGYHVDFYEDSGDVVASPSKLIDITGDMEKVLR